MSANKELDEIQRMAIAEASERLAKLADSVERGETDEDFTKYEYRNGYVAVTVDGEKSHVSGIYATHDEALDATKWNKGVVTVCSVRYRTK